MEISKIPTTVQNVQGWYEKSVVRNVHGTKSPEMVRNVYGTNSLWYEKSGNRRLRVICEMRSAKLRKGNLLKTDAKLACETG